ncbi:MULTISPECIES: hypothetical protein [Rhizobium]|uniref:hypothetical protein n=1 Tax=Rhizobium TaxID=379 RepID=UPI00195942D1|nr:MULTISPECIES: hypothetical protein [Rhizobium]MBM7047200.1 hypothetical protein [Rhizobium lusitanum]
MIIRSMARRGNPYDYTKADNFMKTLKVEAVYPMAFKTYDDVIEHLPYFVEEVYTNVGCIQRAATWVPQRFEHQHVQQTGRSAA